MKKTTYIKSCVSLFLLFLSFPQVRSQTPIGSALLDKSQWNLLFRDDFDYANIGAMLAVNGGDTWSKYSPPSSCLCCSTTHNGSDEYDNPVPITYFSEDFLSVSNGLLRIDNKHEPFTYSCNNETYANQSGQVWYQFNEPSDVCTSYPLGYTGFLYGMFEVRCKLPHNSGSWPAFWMTNGGEWEIDAFEGGCGPNCFSSTDHWCHWVEVNGQGECVDYDRSCGTIHEKLTPGNISDDFHTWTVVWTPTEISWFFDGKEIRTDYQTDRISAYSCDGREHVLIGNGAITDAIYNSQTENDPFLVDYVAFYKPCDDYSNTPCNTDNDYLFTNLPSKQYLNPAGQAQSLDNSTHLMSSSGEPNTNVGQSKISIDHTNNSIYFRKTNNYLHKYYYNGSTWLINQEPGTDVLSDITFAPLNSRVYYRSTANTLRYSDNGGTATIAYSNGCAGSLSLDNLDNLYFIDLSGNICICKYNQTSASVLYSNANALGGVSAYDGGKRLVYTGNDGNLYRLKKNKAGLWVKSTLITGGNVSADVIIEYPSNFNSMIFYRGNDGYVYNYYFDGIIWHNPALTSWTNYDNNAAGGLALSADKQMLFFKGSDTRMWYYFTDKGWSSGTGRWYNTVLDWGKTNASSSFAVRNDGVLHYVGTDNKMYECNWISGEHTLLACDYADYHDVFKEENDVSELLTSNEVVEIYPNPAGDFINVKLNGKELLPAKIKIFNLMGQIEYERELSELTSSIYVGGLSTGIYSVVVANGNYITQRKIMKE